MTRMVIRSMVLGIAVMGVAIPLHAQMMAPESSASTAASEPEAGTIAEVRTDGGVIMISDGGPFQTAVPGQRVSDKSRLMVSKESAATVVYDDGCRQKFDKPGVYPISSTCALPPPAVAASGGGGVPKTLIVAGAVVAAYAGYEIYDRLNDDDDQPPASR